MATTQKSVQTEVTLESANDIFYELVREGVRLGYQSNNGHRNVLMAQSIRQVRVHDNAIKTDYLRNMAYTDIAPTQGNVLNYCLEDVILKDGLFEPSDTVEVPLGPGQIVRIHRYGLPGGEGKSIPFSAYQTALGKYEGAGAGK